MKKMVMALLASLMLLSTGALAENKLIVATDNNFPPFEFKDPATGKYTGFDVELWDALAQKIGVQYELHPMGFNNIIPELKAARVDVAIAGISIKPEREKSIDFSSAYYISGLQLLARDDEKNINSIKDLAGKAVATKLGTTSETFAKQHSHAKEVRLFPNNEGMFTELMTGGVDAVVFDSPVIADFARGVGEGKVKVVGPVYEGEPYGICFPKDSPWLKKVNAALAELKADGEYKKLYRKWFASDPE